MAGLAYAIVLSVPWMLAADGGFPLTRFLWLVACYAWPTAVTLLLVATTTHRHRVIVAGIYVAVIIAIGTIARAQALVYFLVLRQRRGHGALLAAFLTRRIRAVGPLILAFMVTGVTGAFALVSLAGSHEDTVCGALRR